VRDGLSFFSRSPWTENLHQRGDDVRAARRASGVQLHHQYVAHAVDDHRRQPVGLGMDQAIIGVSYSFRAAQRRAKTRREEGAIDNGVASRSAPRGDQRVGLKNPAPSRSPRPRSRSRCAGRQRLRRRVIAISLE